MLAGHFGLAAAVKAKEPEIPVWALMLSTQLLDVIFVPLFVMGIETIEGPEGYGKAIIHADYTHSLLGALLIAFVAGMIAWKVWNRRSGLIIGSVVFSHWLLDLLVHHADLPILPGNIGNLPLLGFGLWKWSAFTITLELAMVTIGAYMYYRSTMARAKSGNSDTKMQVLKKRRALLSSAVMGLLLGSSLLLNVLGL